MSDIPVVQVDQNPGNAAPRELEGVPMDDPGTIMDDTSVLMGGGIIISNMPKVTITGEKPRLR